jgi:photosystem II stability/assembly factor-like uncharacterized protein
MKKIFLLAIVLFSLNIPTTIATNVPGGSVSGTWTIGGSPYNIQGNILIPNDSTLTIQPGVTINFQGTYKLNVQGRLLAIGTVTDTIIITASNTTNGWRGIRFNNTAVTNDSSKIIFCKLEYGKATGASPDDCGGALYFNNFSKIIVSNSSIINCTANYAGAGIYCRGTILLTTCCPTISYNKISNNAASSSGGGICCDLYSNPNILNNTISNNTANCCAGSSGGGIYISGNPVIMNNTITNNIGSNGGGIYSNGNNPIISNNIISYNITTIGMGGGGGIDCDGTSNASISNNTISYNSSCYTGGGINCNGGNLSINNNRISNNTASNNGGGIYCSGSGGSLSINNNSISNNTALGGGGIAFDGSSITIFNNTIANNSAANGGALCCKNTSNPNLNNCILWGNTASTSGAQVFLNDEASDPNFYYCDVQGSSAAFELNGNFYTGIYQNNMNADPKFVSPSGGSGTGFNGIIADWSLQNTSPCIDAGDPDNTYSSTDIAGNPRVNVCRIDIGAYEYQIGIPFVVSLSITQPIICNSSATGEITASVSGGTLPYTYLWSNGETTPIISGLVAGTYTVTVYTASYGCVVTKDITLSQPLATSVDAGADTTITCGGSAELNANPKWVLLNSGTSNNLNSVYFTNSDTGYAVGGSGSGIILKTINGGDTWTATSIGMNGLSSVFFLNSDTGYVVGISGTILKTTNGGTNWTVQVSGTASTLTSVYFTDSNSGYTVGTNGKILKTINGGTNWNTQTSGTTNALYSVYFTDANTGYAVGESGIILKTSNGGTIWNAQTSGTTVYLQSVYFTNANTGYIAGDGGTILKTINGGTNWSVQTNIISSWLQSVYFITPDTGYAVGGNGAIIKTSNGGTDWTAQTSGTSAFLYSVYFTDANTGYTAGSNGTILKLSIPISYSWSPTIGLSDPNIANPIASPTATTPYIVSATSENGCIAKDTVTVFVNPLTADAGMDKTIICGGNTQLDNVTSNYTGTEILSYLWSPAAGLNYDTIPNPTATVTTETKFYITVTTPNGCTAIDSVIVHVNPLTANAGSDKNLICGGTAQLDNVNSNYSGTGMLSYLWSPSAGLNNSTIPNPTATVTSNTKYTVTITTPNGCNAIDSVAVFVNPLIISGTDGAIFCGDSTILNTNTNYTGTGTLAYIWSPSFGLSDTTIANPYVAINTNQLYNVTVTTPNGCIATDNVNVSIIPMNAPEICIVTVDSTNKNIVVWNKPVSAAIDSFYIYRETNITGIYNTIASISYDSLSVFVDTTSFPDVQSNKYQISVKDDCGLESAKSAAHKTMHLTINQGMGTTWNLIWEEYEGFTVSTYNIYRGTDANNLVQIGTSPGTNTTYSDLNAPAGYLYYQVELTSPNFCNPTKSFNSSRSNIATNNPNGINELSNASDFIIYPNPANDKIEISVSQKSEIEILNAEGQVLKSINVNDIHTSIDISEFAKGVYFVKAQTSKGVEVKKFVKE